MPETRFYFSVFSEKDNLLGRNFLSIVVQQLTLAWSLGVRKNQLLLSISDFILNWLHKLGLAVFERKPTRIKFEILSFTNFE